MPTTWLAATIETLAGRSPATAARIDRLVADEDQPILGVRAGMVDGARHDLGRAVVAAHRVDRDANPGAVLAPPGGVRAGSPRQRAVSSGGS